MTTSTERHMWVPIEEERMSLHFLRREDAKRDEKVKDIVRRLRLGYREMGIADPTREMVASISERGWAAVAELTGHRAPSETTKRLVLDQFPPEGS